MGRRKTSSRPKGKRTSRPNMVAAAVELSGGPNAVAKIGGVRRQSVYWWIKEWKVERLVDALKLSRASGIPIEKLAGESVDNGSNEESKGSKPAPEKRGSEAERRGPPEPMGRLGPRLRADLPPARLLRSCRVSHDAAC